MWIVRTLAFIRGAVLGVATKLTVLAGEVSEVRGDLHRLSAGQGRITTMLTGLIERTRIMATQADVDRIVAAIDTATTGIRGDIEQLKADVAAGNVLDFSALDAKVEALSALDAENPALVEPPAV